MDVEMEINHWEEQGCKVLSTCKMVFLFILQ